MQSDTGYLNNLIAVIAGVIVLFAAGAAFLGIVLLRDGGSASTDGDVYISMGDSVAAGSGASEPDETSFPALIARSHEGVSLFNIAEAGATTQVVLDEQVSRALGPTGAGRVRFITISAGGNDLAGLIPNAACVEEPLPASCPLDETLAGVEQRLDEILRYLRDANARVPIVLLAYPNFFSGTGHAWEAPAARVLPRLGDVIRSVAARYDRVTVVEPSFEGRGGELTHVLDENFDPHPNDAGHRVIADAIEDALP